MATIIVLVIVFFMCGGGEDIHDLFKRPKTPAECDEWMKKQREIRERKYRNLK